MINEHLKHPNEDIQFAAARCVRQFSLRYHIAKTEAATKSLHVVVDFYMKRVLADPNAAARRGYALALGALSAPVLKLKLTEVVQTLVEAIHIPTSPEMQDAETRRNALEALIEISEKMDRFSESAMSADLYRIILRGMLDALEDYSIDNRGDVGSWVRESALICLTRLTLHLSRRSFGECVLTEDDMGNLIAALLKQCLEKVDKIRLVAGNMLGFLLYADDEDTMRLSSPSACLRLRQQIARDDRNEGQASKSVFVNAHIPFIPHRDELLNLISPINCVHPFRWTAAPIVYDRLVPLMDKSLFRRALICGICSSIGGLSKQVVSPQD